MTVMPGAMSMGRESVMWFLSVVAMSALAAYVAGRALPPARDLQCSASPVPPLSSATPPRSGRCLFGITAPGDDDQIDVDGLIYASLTAGVFGWLWPRYVSGLSCSRRTVLAQAGNVRLPSGTLRWAPVPGEVVSRTVSVTELSWFLIALMAIVPPILVCSSRTLAGRAVSRSSATSPARR